MVAARITDPVDGATSVDRTRPITWTPVPNAQAYYLYVGTAPGLNDVVDSFETQQTSFSIAHVPVNRTLYARLYTEYNGNWYYTQSTFVAEPLAAEFTYPLSGATGVSLAQPFQWTPAIGGQSYKLWVGTTPGGNDLLDSGTLAGLSYSPATLPLTGTLYARLWTMIGGSWTRHTDIAFTLDATALPATIIFRSTGSSGSTRAGRSNGTPCRSHEDTGSQSARRSAHTIFTTVASFAPPPVRVRAADWPVLRPCRD